MILTPRNVARSGGTACKCCRWGATVGTEAKRQRRELRRREARTWRTDQFRND